MTAAFDNVRQLLKQLPGLGYRSSERLALHLLVERPERLAPLLDALRNAAASLHRCRRCGNLCENEEVCPICADPSRDPARLCIVEQIPDLLALERASAYTGHYHVLHGKLSPIQGIGPEQLNFATFAARLASGAVHEIILALSNDIEGEATCHYIQDAFLSKLPHITVCRIGFGIPSGSGITFADPATLKSALEARRHYR
ncbi:MAG: recombination mediator RecR [Puniceicoccales bacterium]|jgi:recombination protein RecR|nr:recombination mediator RecR [Puniceicoccales bacterium]